MFVDRLILIAFSVAAALLWLLVPKKKIREALMAALFCQMLSWFIELTLVQLRWVEYPFREFPHATRMNFVLYTFFHPTICMLSALYAPRSPGKQVVYFSLVALGMAMISTLLATYTDLIVFRKWTWYLSFLMYSIKLYPTYAFTRWFQKGLVDEKEEAQTP